MGGLDGGVEGTNTDDALSAVLTTLSTLRHGPEATATRLDICITRQVGRTEKRYYTFYALETVARVSTCAFVRSASYAWDRAACLCPVGRRKVPAVVRAVLRRKFELN